MFEEKYKTIGLNIMYYRRALSLTQSELAEKAKMSRARVSDIECGKGPFNMESIFCWPRPWVLILYGLCRRKSEK